ncbi:MAG: type III-A CRISPR-associated RAMP protein Csm3 [Ignavibacteriaceae bacterium]|nr:type III-A CRISPR-associated RAMP protein Csm3 [Ignavibacteriaceae bacterium]
MTFKMLGSIVLKGKIETVTGLHIGGSKDKLEIGGVDSPVLRDPNTNYPYIPGSSLKGKMRALLELSEGKVDIQPDRDGKLKGNPSKDKTICKIFGSTAKEATGPTRIIVRDAYPDNKTVSMWETLDSELQYTEFKGENTIDRLTSEANPRFTERVVKGSKFDFTIVYNVFDHDGDGGNDDKVNFYTVLKALKLLENSGIGGSVSRGYGQIKFHCENPVWVTVDDYREGNENYKKAVSQVEGDDLPSLHELQLPNF